MHIQETTYTKNGKEIQKSGNAQIIEVKIMQKNETSPCMQIFAIHIYGKTSLSHISALKFKEFSKPRKKGFPFITIYISDSYLVW